MRLYFTVRFEAKPVVTGVSNDTAAWGTAITTVKQTNARTKPIPPVDPELVNRGVENNENDVPEEAAAGVSEAAGRTSRERLEKLITSSIRPKNKFRRYGRL
jgi:hypothetical protein